MTTKWMCAFFLVISATLFAQGNHAADEQSIRTLNETVLKAFNMGDIATVDRIEDANFSLAGDFGEVSKVKQLEKMRARKPGENATNITLHVENQQLHFYGHTALLTEVDHYMEEADADRFQTTSLWVRRGKEWKVAYMHYSLLVKR